MNKIKVLFKEPNKAAEEREINSDLKTLQKLVGGYIEVVWLEDIQCQIILNEEGKIINLKPNVYLWSGQDYVAGNLIVSAFDEDGESISLTKNQILQAKKYLKANHIST